MARKLNASKPPHPNNGVPDTLNRRSQPPAATLYLMQLRAQGLRITPSTSIRLKVSAENGAEEAEQPVKIVRIDDEQ
ncbi:MAG: hypothetical protein ACREE6_11420 [Limisphaerales bacterium]